MIISNAFIFSDYSKKCDTFVFLKDFCATFLKKLQEVVVKVTDF